MYYYVYKITNLVNDKIYIGQHQTNDLNDDYLGSGNLIRRAVKKYGRKNFKKDIIKFCESKEEMNTLEKELITKEYIDNNDTYNIALGGHGGSLTNGKVTVIDNDGITSMVNLDDPRYISGELIFFGTNFVTIYEDNKFKYINKNNEEYTLGKVKHMFHYFNTYKDSIGKKYFLHKDDEFIKANNLIIASSGMMAAKDKDNNIHYISVYDPRYLNKELVSTRNGVTIDEKQKLAISNSMKNRIWIVHIETHNIKFVYKEQLDYYLSLGYINGRKIINKTK